MPLAKLAGPACIQEYYASHLNMLGMHAITSIIHKFQEIESNP